MTSPPPRMSGTASAWMGVGSLLCHRGFGDNDMGMAERRGTDRGAGAQEEQAAEEWQQAAGGGSCWLTAFATLRASALAIDAEA